MKFVFMGVSLREASVGAMETPQGSSFTLFRNIRLRAHKLAPCWV
jgi:hypothetical protein